MTTGSCPSRSLPTVKTWLPEMGNVILSFTTSQLWLQLVRGLHTSSLSDGDGSLPGSSSNVTEASTVQLAARPSPPKVLQWTHRPLGHAESSAQAVASFTPPTQTPAPTQSDSLVQGVPA